MNSRETDTSSDPASAEELPSTDDHHGHQQEAGDGPQRAALASDKKAKQNSSSDDDDDDVGLTGNGSLDNIPDFSEKLPVDNGAGDEAAAESPTKQISTVEDTSFLGDGDDGVADAFTKEEEEGLKGLEEVLGAASEDEDELPFALQRSASGTNSGHPSTTSEGRVGGGGGGTKAVTVERKEDLLLQARKSRKKWIGRVPTPYRMDVSTSGDDGHKQLSSLRSLRATRRLPSAVPVLSLLYGLAEDDDVNGGSELPSQVVDRIRTVLGKEIGESDGGVDSIGSDNDKLVPTVRELVESELEARKDDPYLRDYHAFWTRLQEPACATLVQGMRNFCGKIRDVNGKSELVARLRAYLQGTYQSLQTHVLWKKRDGGGGNAAPCDERVRRSLEAFIYGQCYPHIESVLWTREAEQKEQEWMDRLNDLQFVTSHHLEIACLSGDGLDMNALLKEPMHALKSVGSYFSPYDKLKRILALYHGANAALSAALNADKKDGTPAKLPSADDVLPTIILTVILTKPERLLLDLEIVEDFSPPEYLRGEAGYAFTNLYGAVHFLQELDLNEPKSLSITPDEFRKGVEASREKTEKRIRTSIANSGANLGLDLATSLPRVAIPPIEVRRARLRGEEVDVEWAGRWAEQDAAIEPNQADGERGNADDLMRGLPAGFNRTYSFFGTRPEDVKLSDLPRLLSEYRQLVHITELLLAERVEKTRAERKAKRLSAQQDLHARVREVDPSLLSKKS